MKLTTADGYNGPDPAKVIEHFTRYRWVLPPGTFH